MESQRLARISKLLQKELGEIFRVRSAEWAPGAMLSVTKVQLTKDLSIARVFVSVFPNPDKKQIMQTIQDRKKEIRFVLGNVVGKQLRQVPDLYFFLDDSLDYIDRIDSLLKDPPEDAI